MQRFLKYFFQAWTEKSLHILNQKGGPRKSRPSEGSHHGKNETLSGRCHAPFKGPAGRLRRHRRAASSACAAPLQAAPVRVRHQLKHHRHIPHRLLPGRLSHGQNDEKPANTSGARRAASSTSPCWPSSPWPPVQGSAEASSFITTLLLCTAGGTLGGMLS